MIICSILYGDKITISKIMYSILSLIGVCMIIKPSFLFSDNA